MKKILSVFLLLALASLEVRAEETFTREMAKNTLWEVVIFFHDSIAEPVLDQQGPVDAITLIGMTVEEALDLGHFLADKASEIEDESIPAEYTLLQVGDRMTDYENLDLSWFVELAHKFNAFQAIQTEQALYVKHCSLEKRICEIENMGLQAPDHIYDQYNEYAVWKNSQGNHTTSMRTQTLGTPGHYVSIFNNGELVRIQLQDTLLDIRCVFPAEPAGSRTPILTGCFGDKRHNHRHMGIDIHRGWGYPVKTMGAGIVTNHTESGYGKHTRVYHPQWRLESLYAHGAKHLGPDSVFADHGSAIMTEGSSGTVIASAEGSGIHIHMELYYTNEDGRYPLNPLGLLKVQPRKGYPIEITDMKDVLYLRRTTWGYTIISEEQFKEATEASVALEQ